MAVSTIPVRLAQRRFGETVRRDPGGSSRSWSRSACRRSSSTRRGRRSRASTTRYGPYLSPFYSPELFGDSPHSWFGPKPGRVARVAAVLAGAAHPADPGALPAHLLLLPRRVLQGVLGRSAVVHGRRAAHELPGRELVPARSCRTSIATCCSCRSACSLILAYDVWKALWFTDPATGAESFGIGVGTLVLAANVVLLSGYMFGCHSLRHLVGGCVDQLSRAPLGRHARTRA